MSDTVNPAATQDLDAKIVEIVARAICYERPMPACDCRHRKIPCRAPIENLLHKTNPVGYQARAALAGFREAGFEIVPRDKLEPVIAIFLEDRTEKHSVSVIGRYDSAVEALMRARR